MFCAKKASWRKWSANIRGYSFQYEILRNIRMGPLVINYNLLLRLFQDRYDAYLVVDAPQYVFSTSIVFLIAKLLRKPIIIWSESFETDFPIYTYWIKNRISKYLEKTTRIFFRIFGKIVYEKSDGIIACGNKVKKYLKGLGIPSEKIFVGMQVMPENLMEQPLISKSDMEFNGKKIVLYVGYFKRMKGIEYLIRAIKSLNRKDVVLMIVGAGEEENNLKTLTQGDENIYFTGYVEEKDKARYYSMATVFVLPTLHDSWGLVINEAMYYGLPIITTDAAGASELIDRNGFVVRSGDEGELKWSIEKLLDDEAMRRSMAYRSKEIIRKYDVDYAIRVLNRAIQYALKKQDWT